MGEILVAGITHYPPLAGPDESMAWILKRMLTNPRLPDEYRTPAGWPPAMREEWGADEGTAAAGRHRASHRLWLGKVRAALDAFAPDFIVVWGDDQYENFREEIVPAYCIYAHDSFAFAPPPKNIWDDPPGQKFQVKGAPAAAKYLASRLIEAGFDTAYSTSRCIIRSATPSPTLFYILTTIVPAFRIRSSHSPSIVTAGVSSRSAAAFQSLRIRRRKRIWIRPRHPRNGSLIWAPRPPEFSVQAHGGWR
jgi:hypothetical protein